MVRVRNLRPRSLFPTVVLTALLIVLPLSRTPLQAFHGDVFGHLHSQYRHLQVVDEVAQTLRRGWERRTWRKARVRALRTWASGGQVSLSVYSGPPGGTCGGVRQSPGTLRVCLSDSAGTSFAYIYQEDGHIVSGEIAMSPFHTQGFLRAKRAIWCHEVGHILGLGHRAQGEDSCMAPFSSARSDAHDWEAMAEAYDHEDAP